MSLYNPDKTTNFSVAPTNYLGHEYASFKNSLYKLALTNPTAYFDLREKVLQSVQRDAINDIYTTVFNLLNTGTDKKNQALFSQKVGYPQQEINKIGLGFSSTLDGMVNELVELLMPIDFNTIMNKKLASTPSIA